MFKNSCLLLLSIFLLFAFINCYNNYDFGNLEADDSITVSLVIPNTRGSIDVTEYQIVEADITITAPDTTQETQTWETGDDTDLIFQNKGTGLYNIAVRERDEANNVATYDTDFTVTNGYNLVITVYLGGNIYVVVDDTDIPFFVEYQRNPTNAAVDWEAFTLGTENYLAVANLYDGSTYNTDSVIYRWNGSQFTEIQAISTNGACNWEAFTIGTETYLAVANFYNNSTHNTDSRVYRWNGSQFMEVQAISTNGAHYWEAFSVGTDTYLAVANHHDDSTYNIDSSIYRWDGNQFNKVQSIPTQGAIVWEAFSIGTDTYLAVGNHYDGVTFSIDSVIYRLEWN